MEENSNDFQNTLYTNDNLFVLRRLDSESVDLIYLDPPFNSKRMYENPIGTGSKKVMASFKDIWTWEEDVDKAYLAELGKTHPDLVKYIFSIGQLHSEAMMSYITYMTQRVLEMHRILKPTGSLYYHCDPTAGHFVKLMLDGIFGRKNLINEIIWSYQGTGESDKAFKRKHDNIYAYAKKYGEHFFNTEETIEPVSEKSTKRYNKQDENGKYKEIRHRDGKVYKQYERTHMRLRDVWEIPIVNAYAKERTGYPTQKPLKLLNRIINASCPVGGLVVDPFCGCATTCIAAEIMNRKWIGIDIDKLAVRKLAERITTLGDIDLQEIGFDDKYRQGLFDKSYIVLDKPSKRTDVVEKDITEPTTRNEIKEILYQKQKGRVDENGMKKCLCNGCFCEYLLKDLEIDHIIPKAKGGGNYLENYQLLCSSCNRMKGDRTMAYLRMKNKAIRKILDEVEFGE